MSSFISFEKRLIAPRTLFWSGMGIEAAASTSTAGGFTGRCSRATMSSYAVCSSRWNAAASRWVEAGGGGAGAAGTGTGWGAVAQAAVSRMSGSHLVITPSLARSGFFQLHVDLDRLHVRRVSQLDRLFLSLQHAVRTFEGYRNPDGTGLGEDAGRDGHGQRLAHVALRPRHDDLRHGRRFLLRLRRGLGRGAFPQRFQLGHDVDRGADFDVLDLREGRGGGGDGCRLGRGRGRSAEPT